MVTVKDSINCYAYVGLSSDTKPTDCGNGSTFYEMDTKKSFIYDETNKKWLDQ